MSMATGGGASWSALFGAMRDLRTAWPARGWSWDSRMSCVTSSFAIELEAKARAAAAPVLPTEWSSATIARAPPPVREIAERTGGLRPGQLLLASAAVGAGFAYALWWPWGDGMTTSARIGLGGSGVTSDAFQRLRDVFGVEL